MKNRRKQRQTRAHPATWAFFFALLALALCGAGAYFGIMRLANTWTADLPRIDDAEAFNYAQESVVYAADGSTLLARFQLEKRDPVEYDQISPYVLQGTVDTEDVRFYQHNGADLVGIARAVLNNLTGGSLEGASTITQQLMRNTVLSQEATDITFERKVREIQLAVEFEKERTKDEILVMYLNTINYGDGCYGIEAAAQNYFQVSAADLTLGQAAALVGIPQSPESLNPKNNLEACQQRRNVVLDRMLSAGHITQEEHDAARAEPLTLNPAPEAPFDGIYAYPHFTSYVRDKLLEDDNAYGCSYAELFEGGLTIYTTLDPTLQQQAEAARDAQLARMPTELDAALVAIDPQTGYVRAMVGGKDYGSDEFGQVNLATGTGGTGRQAGSSFKAFTLAAAIKAGIDPKTLIDCTSPMTLSGGTRIENFGNADYGIRSIQRATAVSSNTGYVRLIQEVGPQTVVDLAHEMGIESELDAVPTLTLGASSVTPLEMASAYATLAAGGVHRDPVVITKIVNADGEVVYEAPDTSERVLSEEVSGAVTSVLRTVFESSEGTAYGSGPSNGQPVAGKTGTSDDFVDHWLVGYSPTLSCATWIGNPAGSIATPSWLSCNAFWHDFMSAALSGTPIQPFPSTAAPAYDNDFNKRQKDKLGTEEERKKKEEEEKKKEEEEEKKREEAEKDDEEDDKPADPAPPQEPEEPQAPDPSTAPDCTGLTLEEAAKKLEGYEAGYVEQASDTVPKGTVIKQEVRDGKVVLIVSSGPGS